MSDQRPLNRRRFFREGLRELLKPLAQAAEPIEQAVRQLTAMENEPRATRSAAGNRSLKLTVILRPPGALPESQFLETCSKCGECVRACPAQAIRIDVTGALGDGFPFIDADAMPCVLCDSLACMNNCPSGALKLVPRFDIDLGTAEWRDQTCLRTKGEDCTICVDQCPLGTAAIELREGRVNVIADGCVGCGVCQNYCPTAPKSIVVIPRDERDRVPA